jgi:uncharacterized protein with GYD domain
MGMSVTRGVVVGGYYDLVIVARIDGTKNLIRKILKILSNRIVRN